jgi:hypothetical protein
LSRGGQVTTKQVANNKRKNICALGCKSSRSCLMSVRAKCIVPTDGSAERTLPNRREFIQHSLAVAGSAVAPPVDLSYLSGSPEKRKQLNLMFFLAVGQ